MKNILPVITAISIAFTTGCSLFQSSDDFDPDQLPSTASGDVISIDSRISTSIDDVEERSGGYVATGNATLELTTFKGAEQIVGLRFNVDLPKDATLIDSYIQFTAASGSSDQSSLVVYGEPSDNAAAFSTDSQSIRVRPLTENSVSWSPAAWNSAGEAGAAQRTPSLNPIVEEVTTREGWDTGNTLVFYIKGPGTRVAKSYDSAPNQAPLLVVTYAVIPDEPTYGYKGLSYDPLVRPVYDAGFRDGFLSVDEDGDGLPDSWETAYGLDPTNPNDGQTDLDQDFLTASEEFLMGINPTDQDSDGDGIPDGFEVSNGMNPSDGADALLDFDGDGYSNLDEFLAGTDLGNPSSIPVPPVVNYTVLLEWESPTTRENGEKFEEDEIAGFTIFYGNNANELTESVPIEDPAVRSKSITFNDPGTYYFSINVIDTDKAESKLSDPLSITVGN